jgi:hypothetical protein
MTSQETPDGQQALSREWLAARIVFLGGFLIAIGVVGYFAYQQFFPPPQSLPTAVSGKEAAAKTLAAIEVSVCNTGLQNSKDLGIVPQYGVLGVKRLLATRTQGRYICVAATHAAQYLIMADLVCNDFSQSECVRVVRILEGNGTVLYQRPS